MHNGKYRSLTQTGNAYLSPAWMTNGLAGLLTPSLTPSDVATPSGAAATANTPPDKPQTLAVSGPQDPTALHMTTNAPLLASALIAKESALASPLLKVIKPAGRYSLLFHFEPSVSFRVLKSKTAITTNYMGFIVVDNNGYDINHLVDQRPSVGFELGTDLLYALNSRLTLKAGLQFNYSRYSASAVTTYPHPANIDLGGPVPTQTVSAGTSTYTNVNGQNSSTTWIPDQRIELSLPVGAEYRMLSTRSFSWIVSGTLQPSYILNAKAFLLSADYKEYVQYPNLLRPWNLNAGAETFLRFNRGDIQVQIGPQFRYQVLSSFISSYQISEHLYDVGFKIGIVRNIR